MESIASLNHLPRLPVVQVHPLENVLGRELIVDQVVVFVVYSLVNYLLVDPWEFLCELGGVFAGSGVGGEPSCAGADFEAVEEVIDFVVGNIEGVDGSL